MRMPPNRPIEGSGDAGAAEAPKHGVNMEEDVSVAADEVENKAAVGVKTGRSRVGGPELCI